jgi:CIC family chloride channel protein
MVYIGALIGNQTKRLNLAIPNLSTVSIACGVAAAIAAAFNAPIAGLVFAHEAIVRHYSMQSFAPATVAATSGYVVANVIFDRPPLFLIQPGEILQGSEFLLFALLGLCAAAVSILYMRTILRTAKFARELNISPPPRGLIAGVGLGLVTLWLPEITGVGQFTMRFATIDGAFSAFELGGLMLGKIALTAFCLGFGFVGGVFSPALVVGALFGGLFWTLLSVIMPDTLSSYSIYVICGMMAVTSPVIGAPLTTILIVFELTRSYDLAIASMIAVVFSNLVTYRFFGRSLFDHQLLMKGVDLSQGRDQARLSDMRVRDYVSDEAPIFSQTTSQQQVLEHLRETGWNEAYAVDSETQKFVGFLRAVDLEAGSQTPIASKLQISDLVFDETTSVRQAMEKLSSFVGDAIPIIKSSDGSLVGVVTEGAIIQSYLNLAADLRREENAGL